VAADVVEEPDLAKADSRVMRIACGALVMREFGEYGGFLARAARALPYCWRGHFRRRRSRGFLCSGYSSEHRRL